MRSNPSQTSSNKVISFMITIDVVFVFFCVGIDEAPKLDGVWGMAEVVNSFRD